MSAVFEEILLGLARAVSWRPEDAGRPGVGRGGRVPLFGTGLGGGAERQDSIPRRYVPGPGAGAPL